MFRGSEKSSQRQSLGAPARKPTTSKKSNNEKKEKKPTTSKNIARIAKLP